MGMEEIWTETHQRVTISKVYLKIFSSFSTILMEEVIPSLKQEKVLNSNKTYKYNYVYLYIQFVRSQTLTFSLYQLFVVRFYLFLKGKLKGVKVI